MTQHLAKLCARAAAFAAAISLVSCSAAPVVSDKEEEAAPVIVSLNPCLDAILAEVAERQQIAALSHYSHDPASTSMDIEAARTFPITGGTAEEILALAPDLVLASTFIDPATRAALDRSGITVETFGSPVSVEESFTQIRDIAALVGQEEAGAALVERIGNAPVQPRSARIPALLWQPGQIVAGEASLVAEHLSWAGMENHAAQSGLGQADHVSLESILANPPRILLIAGESAGQSHPLLQHLRGTLVAQFPPRLFYCAGPTIPEARARLAGIRAEFDRDFYQGPD